MGELFFVAAVTIALAILSARGMEAPIFSREKKDWAPEPPSLQKWIFVTSWRSVVGRRRHLGRALGIKKLR
jgi:hypothetical protein